MRACARLLLLSLVVCAGCAPPVDLSTGLEVQNVSSGWFDAGIQNGQNKLVPSVTFALKNLSSQNLPVLQVQAKFQRVTDAKEEWWTEFKTVAGSEGLAPGTTTQPLVLRSQKGYTGSNQSREEMLSNSHFIDAEVELTAKYGSTQWKRLGKYPVTRLLLTK